MKLVRALLTALIDRWRSDTSMYHLRVGEMIITLQDETVLLGLCIDGPSITGTDDKDWAMECKILLGTVPPLRWLERWSVEADVAP